MRDGECLVQVDMTYIGPVVARASEPDLSVQVRSVQVHKTAVLMDGRARIDDALFEDAVRRRICHHERSKIF